MRAVQFADYGPPEVLRLVELPDPEPGPTQVVIRVAAAGVNPADWKWRSGRFAAQAPLPLPHVIGYDVAGVIAALGAEVTGFAVGDRVVSTTRHGYAELAPAEAAALARLPQEVDFATAAALPCAALSGVQLIEDWIRPTPGQTVLVTGATGAVGRFAAHAARRSGARVIAAVRPAYFDEARALGAEAVIDLGDGASGLSVDHVADSIGGEPAAAFCRGLSAVTSIVSAASDPIPPDGLKALPEFRSYRAIDGERLARVVADVAAGAADMPIARRLPLAEAAEAHRLIEAGGLRGKLILEP